MPSDKLSLLFSPLEEERERGWVSSHAATSPGAHPARLEGTSHRAPGDCQTEQGQGQREGGEEGGKLRLDRGSVPGVGPQSPHPLCCCVCVCVPSPVLRVVVTSQNVFCVLAQFSAKPPILLGTQGHLNC